MTGLDLLAGRTPADFPFINDPSQAPAQPSDQPDSPIAALAQSAQSTFGLAVLARLNTRR